MPSITYVVDKRVIATAWAIAGVILSLSQMLMPLIFIKIIEMS